MKAKRGRPAVKKGVAGYLSQQLYDKTKPRSEKYTVGGLIGFLSQRLEQGDSWNGAKRAAAVKFGITNDAIRKRLQRSGFGSGQDFARRLAKAFAPARGVLALVGQHVSDDEITAMNPATPWSAIIALARSRAK